MLKFSWVDLLMVAIIFRCIYVGKKSDIAIELFKLLGIFFGIVVSLHYYLQFYSIITRSILFPDATPEIISFLILIFWVYFLFLLLSSGWKSIIRPEGFAVLSKYGSLFFASIRGILVCSIVIVGFMLSDISFLAGAAQGSFSGRFIKGFSPAIYRFSYDKFIGKVTPGEIVNEKVFEVMAETPPKQTEKPEELRTIDVVVYPK
ncbi:MAG: CvpA family protein [Candidatus Zapsychrus exili]|nr:CvpA family protein [Candidatus Zapsychrus exili]